MNKSIAFIATAILAGFMSSCCGCRGAKSKNPHFLTTEKWSLIEMEGKTIAGEERQRDGYTLSFNKNEGKIVGVGDCNNFFGTYNETSVRKLAIQNIGSTRKMCRNQQQENKFFEVLQATDSYTIDQDMLMLQKEGEVVAIFRAVADPKE